MSDKNNLEVVQDDIIALDDRSHILLRNGMYISGISSSDKKNFYLQDNKFNYTTVGYIEGLIKIIFEIIDNSVDVAVKSEFKYGNKINISINKNTIKVEDNGYGINQDIDQGSGLSKVVLAIGSARAGSNFNQDNKERLSIGLNGVGSYLTNVFSSKFSCETYNGVSKTLVEYVNNAETYNIKTTKSKREPGTIIEFTPDLPRFNIEEIDETHINIIIQRLIILAMTYPEITLTFSHNTKKVNLNFKGYKQFIDMFSDQYELIQFDNGFIAYFPTPSDEFQQYTILNGQVLSDGGTHIDYINNKVVNFLREKYSKKYKDIKQGDIRSKLCLVSMFRSFPNPTFSSQTKDRLTNAGAEVGKYLQSVDFDKLSNQVFKNQAISDLITEVYKIKEELQKRRDLQKLDTKVTKIKSDKYSPPIGEQKYLFLAEGDSASGGLMRELGRQGNGYFALRGKILNVLEAQLTKIANNVEVDTIIKILGIGIHSSKKLKYSSDYFYLHKDQEKFIAHTTDLIYYNNSWKTFNEMIKLGFTQESITTKVPVDEYYAQYNVNQPISPSYNYVVIATDADADGLHIRSLLITLFETFAPQLIKAGKLKFLKTPIIAFKDKGKIIDYYFTLGDYDNAVKTGKKFKGDLTYYKGLGSWSKGDLKYIVDRDGIDNFIISFEYDETSTEMINNWMSKSTADYRKERISSHQIDINVI